MQISSPSLLIHKISDSSQLDEQIFAVQSEKARVESELSDLNSMKPRNSINSSFEAIFGNLVNNVEENLELRRSIEELADLQGKNVDLLNSMKREI